MGTFYPFRMFLHLIPENINAKLTTGPSKRFIWKSSVSGPKYIIVSVKKKSKFLEIFHAKSSGNDGVFYEGQLEENNETEEESSFAILKYSLILLSACLLLWISQKCSQQMTQESFQYKWLNIQWIDAAFPLLIMLFSNHLYWNPSKLNRYKIHVNKW